MHPTLGPPFISVSYLSMSGGRLARASTYIRATNTVPVSPVLKWWIVRNAGPIDLCVRVRRYGVPDVSANAQAEKRRPA